MRTIQLSQNTNAPSTKWEIKTKKRITGTIVRNSLGHGMSLSHSISSFTEPTESSVLEKNACATFVFILSGELILKPDTSDTWQSMNQLGAYMFFSESNTKIRRRLCPQLPTEAVIIKIPRQTFKTMLQNRGNSSCFQNMGTRIFSQKMSTHDTLLCKNLTFLQDKGQIDRIICRGRAMELVVQSFFQEQRIEPELSIVLELSDYIKHHIGEVHSLEKLSKIAGMSHTKLNFVFRAQMGLSVFEFIRQQRLLSAETYLQYTDMSISQIAYEVGFCSSSHFSETFKNHKGVSPKIFRKMMCQH